MARACGCARGAPVPAFVRAVLGRRGWSWARTAVAAGRRRALGGACAFAAPTRLTVAELCQRLPARRARAADRAAVRGRAEHAGRAGQRAGVPARAARRAVQRPGLVGSAAAARAAGRAAAAAGGGLVRRVTACACTPARACRDCKPRPAAGSSTAEPFDAVRAGLQRRRGGAAVRRRWRLPGPASRRRLRYEPIVTVYLQLPGRAAGRCR